MAYSLEQCWHRVPGGTAVYGIELAKAIGELNNRDASGQHAIELLGVAGRHKAPPREPYLPPISVHPLPLAGPYLYESWLRFNWPKVEGATGAVDLVHATSIIPAASGAPLVATIHDLAFLHEPDHFTKRGVGVFERSLSILRKRATRIICVSQATLDDCLENGFSAEQLRYVPNGVHHVEVHGDDIEGVRKKYELPEQYLLFVGTLEPRKNLQRLIDAVATLGPDAPPLVVAGATGWGNEIVAQPRVKMLGFVSSSDLAALYAGAAAFCYPSLREGFGLPILEAMSHGVPVVTSRGSSTEEVSGGAAVLVDPNNTASIADGILRALENREALSQSGIVRSRSVTWERTATLTIEVYREVMEETKGLSRG
ncbi:MAG: glycosyltransferase family 1 protein [Actinomycetes bacterium]